MKNFVKILDFYIVIDILKNFKPPPLPRPYFRFFLVARPFPAPIFEFFQGPAPLPPLFIIFLALNPAARPAGAGSGQRERGPGRGGVDH